MLAVMKTSGCQTWTWKGKCLEISCCSIVVNQFIIYNSDDDVEYTLRSRNR